MILYHVTSEKKARAYHVTGHIVAPVRGFTTLPAAMLWAMRVGRRVIYEIQADTPYKMPDHHNQFGDAWWNDGDILIKNIKCVVSATP